MDIYTGNANHIGKVNDIILNLETGDVVRITTEPLKNITKESTRTMLQKNSVLFKRVKSIRDIMIVSETGGLTTQAEEMIEQAEKKASSPKERATHKLIKKYSKR